MLPYIGIDPCLSLFPVFVSGGEPFDENMETISLEDEDNIGTVVYGKNGRAGNKNMYGPNHAVISNCPPPNVTYNGSLLSSGEVKYLLLLEMIY